MYCSVPRNGLFQYTVCSLFYGTVGRNYIIRESSTKFFYLIFNDALSVFYLLNVAYLSYEFDAPFIAVNYSFEDLL